MNQCLREKLCVRKGGDRERGWRTSEKQRDSRRVRDSHAERERERERENE